jgi:hypothetical protein
LIQAFKRLLGNKWGYVAISWGFETDLDLGTWGLYGNNRITNHLCRFQKRYVHIFSLVAALISKLPRKRSHAESGDGVTEYSNHINGRNEIVIEGENRIIIPVKNNNARYEVKWWLIMILEKTTKKCPTDDCCPIRQQVEAILGV